MAIRFEITARDAGSRARVGRVTTPHGAFETPAFMPVGTQAAIKGLLPSLVAATGSRIILANTYHLLLRPGPDLVAKMGGLHKWMAWDGSILTDSGGFQVFSLAHISRINDDGVVFKSHLDGARVELTPERAMAVQNALGADIIMAFDDCPPLSPLIDERAGPSLAGAVQDAGREDTPARLATATQRTIRWLDRCVKAHQRKGDQALFGIVQGGTDLALRQACALAVTQHDLPGYAIGGVAVGEGYDQMKSVVEHTAPLLPDDRPRYLMGVGYERDIVMAVRAGVDMFDCVLPTRNGRNANAFTRQGQVRLRNAKYADDPRPIDEGCDCVACSGISDLGFRISDLGDEAKPQAASSNPKSEIRNSKFFSRSYLRHLFMAGEMLGPILVSLHNLRHFQRLMLDIRRAITDNDWSLLRWCD
ncbi:MAG: tRNA guanosine(34) transglycosylase Tgt [Phycisphaeraceae bacterium]